MTRASSIDRRIVGLLCPQLLVQRALSWAQLFGDAYANNDVQVTALLCAEDGQPVFGDPEDGFRLSSRGNLQVNGVVIQSRHLQSRSQDGVGNRNRGDVSQVGPVSLKN